MSGSALRSASATYALICSSSLLLPKPFPESGRASMPARVLEKWPGRFVLHQPRPCYSARALRLVGWGGWYWMWWFLEFFNFLFLTHLWVTPGFPGTTYLAFFWLPRSCPYLPVCFFSSTDLLLVLLIGQPDYHTLITLSLTYLKFLFPHLWYPLIMPYSVSLPLRHLTRSFFFSSYEGKWVLHLNLFSIHSLLISLF